MNIVVEEGFIKCVSQNKKSPVFKYDLMRFFRKSKI